MSSLHGQGARAPRLPCVCPALLRAPRCAVPALVWALIAAVGASALGGCASTRVDTASAVTLAPSTRSAAREPMFPESKWGVSASRRVAGNDEPVPKGGGRYKVGEPYQVGGRWYDPREQPDYDRIGTASWYGSDFHGRHTANGEIFDMHGLTAAHPTLPMPSYAYVTNLSNSRTILVRVNDRGPYVGERMIDLSKESARSLGLLSGGTGRVRVRYAGPAPLDGNDRRERQFLASRPWHGGTNIAAVERDQSAREWAGFQSRDARQAPVRTSQVAALEPLPRRAPDQTYGQAGGQGNGQGYGRSYPAANPLESAWSPASYRAGLAAR